MYFSGIFRRNAKSVTARFGSFEDIPVNKNKLLRDMLRSSIKFGLAYEEYFLYHCYGKDDDYKKSFIGEYNRMKIYKRFNSQHDIKLYHNKFSVYKLYRNYYGREIILISPESNMAEFESFISRHPVFFIKPTDKSCGYGIKKINSNDYPSIAILFTQLTKTGALMCEEEILQSAVTASLNPTSLNTVRYQTVLSGNNVYAFHPFLRVGRYGKNVDNGGSGGIIIPIDEKSGSLFPVGRDENGRYYTEHPDTHKCFKSIRLPEWEKAIELSENLALINPNSRCIGFDIAHSLNGWVMVEANYRGQFIGQQLCDCCGKKNEIESLI